MDELLDDYLNGGSYTQKHWNAPDAFLKEDDTPVHYIQQLALFINQYSWLYRERTIDFFLNDVWSLVPVEWHEPLLSMTDTECLWFASADVVKDTWPQSLRTFVTEAKRLWMPKTVKRDEQRWKMPDFALPSLKLKMSEKKIHEIKRMAELVDSVAIIMKPDEIVDIGSGEGYLTQVLSHQYHHSLTAIDCSESFIGGAIKRQNQIEVERVSARMKALNVVSSTTTTNNNNKDVVQEEIVEGDDETTTITKKKIKIRLTPEQQQELADRKKMEKLEKRKALLDEMDISGPKMCVAMISPEMKNDDFINLLAKHDSSKQYQSIMMIGLHTCGTLASTMIANYVQCNRVNCLVDVGCCYYRIPGHSYQFLSESARGLVELGPAALKLSCEASDFSYGTRSDDQLYSLNEFKYSMKVHFFRVIFETALIRLYGADHSFTIRCISRANSATFELYAQSALKRMTSQLDKQRKDGGGVHDNRSLPTLDQLMEIYHQYENDQKKISLFLLLRGLIAPVLESYIVMDRWLFLDESRQHTEKVTGQTSTLRSFIVPIFEETISPRNYAILSFKQPLTKQMPQ
ncbi:hypothetical protein SAMD00019534_095640 [Acytostelium subglobosum LB1]|uniref:hypothetical protein n=1 Tax=Acytostelium subglobosum LB1 TaxID=1410327 RepID=UPI00064518E8|nr:hypothetical protein SAMD00019534_095640 [Acytostelium subglobosum LB1]GAM26389.1 hypothetical protein SAMD00019534_095640 [Acytostelium subglobosum LB1]|eukprot:XP_012750485.1 hypothetical protein SAMD00019534_095640 [Acytostelium subglobosum LB1]